MTQQIVCDDCGEPIIQTQPYYEINGVLVKMAGEPPALTIVESAKQMHYHQEHLPASVLEPAPAPPVEPEPEPEPVEPAPPIDPDAHPDHELPVPEEPVDPDYGIPDDGEPEEPDEPEEKPERYIDSADPDEGPESGNVQITLHGGGFTDTGEVRFEQEGSSTQWAWGFQVIDDSTMTVTVPPGKGVVDIVLVENQEVVRLEDGFTYV